MELIKLRDKLFNWIKSKPDYDIVQEAPDIERDTVRKMETTKEAKTHWFTLFKMRF